LGLRHQLRPRQVRRLSQTVRSVKVSGCERTLVSVCTMM
ncbi:hypothetical protein BAE44_0003665, partial [Dichanthelium oligosanthes]